MGKDMSRVAKVIYFCAGESCTRKGSDSLIPETRALLKTQGLHEVTHTVKTLCAGQCEHGPIVAVQPDNTWYREMDIPKSVRMVREHIAAGRPIAPYFLASGPESIAEPLYLERN
jgi:(2Fe-2S) ferredoxin